MSHVSWKKSQRKLCLWSISVLSQGEEFLQGDSLKHIGILGIPFGRITFLVIDYFLVCSGGIAGMIREDSGKIFYINTMRYLYLYE